MTFGRDRWRINAGQSQYLPTSPFGIAKTALPDDTAVASNSAVAVQGLIDQANQFGTYSAGSRSNPVLNIGIFSTVYQVPLWNQEYVKIAVTSPRTALETDPGYDMVPIRRDTIVQGDTDSTVCIYMPGVPHGPGNWFRGRYWELTGCYGPTPEQAADGAVFQTRQLARMIDADNNLGRLFDFYYQQGIPYDRPDLDPFAIPDERNGIIQYLIGGASSIGMYPPFVTHCFNGSDFVGGIGNHPVGLLTCNHGKGSSWPGIMNLYDGELDGYPFKAGDWFRFPANAVMPTNLTPTGEVIWRTIQKYGMIIVDKTLSCLAMRATSDSQVVLDHLSVRDGRDWNAYPFANFPWGGMELMVAGQDNDYHPRTNNKSTTGVAALANWEQLIDASALSGIAANSSPSRVKDIGGKGRDGFADAVGLQYVTNQINGLPVLRGDGTTRRLRFASIDLLDFTVFGVVPIPSADTIYFTGEKGYAQLVRLGDFGNGGIQALYADDNGLGDAGGYVDGQSALWTTPVGSFAIFEMTRSGNTVSWWENGAARGSITAGPAGVSGTRFSYLMGGSSNNLFEAGDFALFGIIAANLSSGARSAIRSALGTKFNLAVI